MVEEGAVARIKDELHLHTSAPDFRRDADKNKIQDFGCMKTFTKIDLRN